MLESRWESSTRWLVQHRESILEDENPMLWWMLQRSARLRPDARLSALMQDYRARYLQAQRANFWRPLFGSTSIAPAGRYVLDGMPDYNLLLLYGATCDPALARHPLVAGQLDAGYCDGWPWAPACASHQLIGVRLAQWQHCPAAAGLAGTVRLLQARVQREASLDFRRLDVSIQRMLVLVESGAPERVRPAWVSGFLSSQQPDGGWADFEALLPLPGGRSLGFSQAGVSIGEPRSGFHATVQGQFLLSLLLAGG